VQAKEELQGHFQVKLVNNISKIEATLAIDEWRSVTNRLQFNANASILGHGAIS
jgi:hypothetical protein